MIDDDASGSHRHSPPHSAEIGVADERDAFISIVCARTTRKWAPNAFQSVDTKKLQSQIDAARTTHQSQNSFSLQFTLAISTIITARKFCRFKFDRGFQLSRHSTTLNIIFFCSGLTKKISLCSAIFALWRCWQRQQQQIFDTMKRIAKPIDAYDRGFVAQHKLDA